MRVAELRDRRVLVVGGGLTGGSVVRFLARHGVAFDLVDDGGVPEELAARVSAGRVHARLDERLTGMQDVILLSPGVPRAHPAIRAALEGGVRVAGDIELFADRVAAPVVAVTGSNGKSTVVAWLADLLGRLGVRAVACGNIGLPALDSLAESGETDGTPDCHVLELSSYQLESTISLATHVAVVLNVSDDHLDRYASLADYAAVKRRVQANAACLVVNADDPATAPATRAAAELSPVRARFTARALGPDEVAAAASADGTLWHRAEREGRAWLCRDGEGLLEQSRLALPGDHNAANALAVLALLECLGTAGARGAAAPLPGLFEAGAPRRRALDALGAFGGLPHRTALVGEARGIRWYDDSKGTNVDACVKAVEAMPGPVLLIAGGLSKGADLAPLRPVVERRARAVVLLGRDRMRLHAALEGAAPLHLVDTLEEAVERCAALAREGDAVLLSPACASFDMFADFADRGRRFAELVARRIDPAPDPAAPGETAPGAPEPDPSAGRAPSARRRA